MDFQEFDDLKTAFIKVNLEIIPTVNNHIAILYHNSIRLEDEEQHLLELFLFNVFKLKSDVDTVFRLVDQLLFPLIEEIISGFILKHKIQSFCMLRKYHQRWIFDISKLRLIFSEYTIETNWSNSKRKVYMNLYDVEQSLLAYINFMENRIFQLLIPSNDSQLFVK